MTRQQAGEEMILPVDAQIARRLIAGTQTYITIPVTWENSLVDGNHRRFYQKHWDGFSAKFVLSKGVWLANIYILERLTITPILQPGSEILFKEPWCGGQHGTAIQYKADWQDGEYGPQWRSEYHMPREAIRLKRVVVSVHGVWPKELTEEEIRQEAFWGMEFAPGVIHIFWCGHYDSCHPGMWDHPAWRVEM